MHLADNSPWIESPARTPLEPGHPTVREGPRIGPARNAHGPHLDAPRRQKLGHLPPARRASAGHPRQGPRMVVEQLLPRTPNKPLMGPLVLPKPQPRSKDYCSQSTHEASGCTTTLPIRDGGQTIQAARPINRSILTGPYSRLSVE